MSRNDQKTVLHDMTVQPGNVFYGNGIDKPLKSSGWLFHSFSAVVVRASRWEPTFYLPFLISRCAQLPQISHTTTSDWTRPKKKILLRARINVYLSPLFCRLSLLESGVFFHCQTNFNNHVFLRGSAGIVSNEDEGIKTNTIERHV